MTFLHVWLKRVGQSCRQARVHHQLQMEDVGTSGEDCSSFSDVAFNVSYPCPICLNFVKDEAYLDCCFHKFCYGCIYQWVDAVRRKDNCSRFFVECPVCKWENFSVVHGWTGDFFQRHYVDQNQGYSLKKAHQYRLKCYSYKPGAMYQKFPPKKYWQWRKYLHKNRWLHSWLKREVQALTQEEDVDIILHHVLGIMDSFVRRNKNKHMESPDQVQEEFRALIADASRPFVLGRAERFVDELELFLVCGLNLEAYDQIYLKYLDMETSEITNDECARDVDTQASQIPELDVYFEELEESV